jgi:hypothetical protein
LVVVECDVAVFGQFADVVGGIVLGVTGTIVVVDGGVDAVG